MTARRVRWRQPAWRVLRAGDQHGPVTGEVAKHLGILRVRWPNAEFTDELYWDGELLWGRFKV